MSPNVSGKQITATSSLKKFTSTDNHPIEILDFPENTEKQ